MFDLEIFDRKESLVNQTVVSATKSHRLGGTVLALATNGPISSKPFEATGCERVRGK
jgi:hypothetical protein